MTELPSAVDAAARIAAGDLTAERLVRACLERIDARDADVGAWEHLDPELALAQARRRDAEPARGSLHGVPIGVKDIIDTVDQPTGYGSALYRGHRPARDAACVALARAAGAIVLGKTVSTEFAYFTPGRTANPVDLGHTPGGSSSGSAAAVADAMVPVAFGTQTAGSVIRPAAFCGVVGYKPSFGLINRSGILPFAESLDTVGTFARTVADAALLASVASGRPALAAGDPGPAPQVGLWRTTEWEQASTAGKAAVTDASSRLAGSGAEVVEAELPAWFADLPAAHATVMAFEAVRAFAHERLAHEPQLSPRLRALLDQGTTCTPETYDQALGLARAGREELARVFERHDVLLTPSTPGEAPSGLGSTGDPLFNRTWTLLGTPCVHLPGLAGPTGLPVGVQLVGPAGGDARTLAAAAWAERRLA